MFQLSLVNNQFLFYSYTYFYIKWNLIFDYMKTNLICNCLIFCEHSTQICLSLNKTSIAPRILCTILKSIIMLIIYYPEVYCVDLFPNVSLYSFLSFEYHFCLQSKGSYSLSAYIVQKLIIFTSTTLAHPTVFETYLKSLTFAGTCMFLK